MSRRRKKVESKIAGLFREYGYDVKNGVPYLNLKVKEAQRTNLYDALIKANSEDDGLPTIMWRQENSEWLITMKFTDWIKLYTAYEISETDTAEMLGLPFT